MSRNNGAQGASEKSYAGFGARSIAFLIDTAIILVLIAVAVQVLDHVFGTNTVGVLKAIALGGSIQGESSPYALLLTTSAKQWATILLCAHIVPLVYYTLFESIGLRATPGKLVTGLQVTDRRGKRLSVGAVIWRHIGRYLSALIFFIGFLMAGWTSQRQTLHDMMANALVLKRRRADEALRYSPPNALAMSVCGLLAIVVAGALIVPAGAVVQGYPVEKWKTRLAMHQIKDVVKEVEAYVQETNVWPDHLGKLGLILDDYVGGNIENLEVVKNGVVVVTLQGADSLNGKRLVLSPSADAAGGVRWDCKGTAVSAGLASPGCVRS